MLVLHGRNIFANSPSPAPGIVDSATYTILMVLVSVFLQCWWVGMWLELGQFGYIIVVLWGGFVGVASGSGTVEVVWLSCCWAVGGGVLR